MDLFDTVVASPLVSVSVPGRWSSHGSLASRANLAELALVVGRLDSESDEVIETLLSLPVDDPLVTPVILAGLRRLIFLCRGRDRDLLNDLTTEVAIAIGELRRVRPLRANRRLGYVIVDRARDRQRAALRRQLGSLTFDPLIVAETLASPPADIDDLVAERLRLQTLRARIEASGDPSLVRSWNTLLDLLETPRASQAERDRWKYVRRRLLQHLDPDHAA